MGGGIPAAVALLGIRSAESTAVAEMLRALAPRASALRYGDVGQTDTGALASVVRALAERVTVGLGPACVGLDVDAAQALAEDIVAATQALVMLANEADGGSLVDAWWACLEQVVDRREVAQLIAGTATRLALNAERL